MIIPIITYHALGDAPSPLWTPLELFEAQLRAFSESGYRTIPLAHVVDWLTQKRALPGNALVIAFDDGYQSMYHEAWPRLRAHNFGATVFLITDFCGRDNRWPTQTRETPIAPLLTWDQVAQLAAEGCEFGAHTASHPPLSMLALPQAEEELIISRERIRKNTGQAVNTFAYPYGDTNRSVTELVSRHFDGAAGTSLGMVAADCDPYLLPRIDAYYLKPSAVPRLHAVTFQCYLRLRQAVRSTRRLFHRDWHSGRIERISGPTAG